MAASLQWCNTAAQQALEQLNDTVVVPLKVLPVHLSGGFLAQLEARQQAARFVSRTSGMLAFSVVIPCKDYYSFN